MVDCFSPSTSLFNYFMSSRGAGGSLMLQCQETLCGMLLETGLHSIKMTFLFGRTKSFRKCLSW